MSEVPLYRVEEAGNLLSGVGEPVNSCARSSFKRTNRVENIDLYYTSSLIEFENLENFRTKKCQVIRDQLYREEEASNLMCGVDEPAAVATGVPRS